MTSVRVALYQAQSGIDPAANADRLGQAVRDAAAGGAAMLYTPEMSGLLDRDSQRAASNVRTEEDDLVLATVRDAARASQMWVHLGSLALLDGDGRLVNRGFVIDSAGMIRGRYDKIHLFDVDLPTGESWRESAVYRAGDRAVLVTGTPVGSLGLTICYDLRFPALFAALAEAGADVIAVPAAFTVLRRGRPGADRRSPRSDTGAVPPPADRPGRELIRAALHHKGRRSGSVAQQDRATVS